MALPLLPGNNFTDPTKTKFHRPQTLGWRNGYSIPVAPSSGIGGDPIPVNKLTQEELDELANLKPSLTYGQKVQAPPEDFVPAHVAFDKKVLLFHAYFKQAVHESPGEYYRVRPVKIYYYLEDDAISVVEPVVENSGIPQGKLIKRQRLPKNDLGDYWHWKDFNIGIFVTFYGKVFFICDCDAWTREFMASEGIDLNSPEPISKDPYTESRKQPLRAYVTPSSFDKLKQFIKLDRQVLRFFCVWDDRDSMFGEMRPCILHYYLVDDTVEVREVHKPNDGRDPFPVLVCRQKLAKNKDNVESSFPSCVLELSDHEIQHWFTPRDFMVGQTIHMMGRRFLLYNCDEFTKDYYRMKFGVSEFTPVGITDDEREDIQKVLPPYNGYGSLEDSLQSCLSLVPQPPKKDFIKMLENDHKVLRYAATMETVRPEDKNRRFIISYRLADDMLTIYEPPVRNAGIIGGKYLERTRATKPGSSVDNPEFYTPADFRIGYIVQIFKHRFRIVNADVYVLNYLESHAESYPIETINSIREIHHRPPTTTADLVASVPQGDTNPRPFGNDSGIRTEYQRR
ncbi:hypothetical protein QZH41_008280 [Actinostola sp. cb2023]|nr:hypothetical protein QZH41_008280 [Actinostola sp. cb2023]